MPLRLRLVLWYVLAIGSLGALHPFLALALDRAGASATAAALLMALFPLGFLAAGPLWGWIADRSGRPTAVMRAAATLCGLAVLGAALTEDWRLLVPSLALLALCRAPLMPLVDVLTIRVLKGRAEAYGRVRLWGSLSFVAAVWTIGRFVGDQWRAPLWGSALLLGSAAALSFTLPEAPREALPERPRLGPLLQHPVLRPLLAVAALHGTCIAGYDYFFSLHCDGLGLPPSVAASGFALGVGAEVAVMAAGPWLLPRLGTRRLILLGIASDLPRFATTALATTAPVLAGVQVLHGLGFGAWWIGVVALLSQRAPQELRNSAQTLLMAANYGLGPLFSLGLAAVVVERTGSASFYGLLSVLAAAALALALLRLGPRLRQAPLPGDPA